MIIIKFNPITPPPFLFLIRYDAEYDQIEILNPSISLFNFNSIRTFETFHLLILFTQIFEISKILVYIESDQFLKKVNFLSQFSIYPNFNLNSLIRTHLDACAVSKAVKITLQSSIKRMRISSSARHQEEHAYLTGRGSPFTNSGNPSIRVEYLDSIQRSSRRNYRRETNFSN